ncbi:16S rRNA (cytidine(1402)-2'-O)-methyltransferase [Marinobacterium jannaschii]|uniref:16S rRNA (cytidine(1402)-2'-O)-methyltransferase n=1 Tax=Marinobacterium jannaschii TaxID=64970 RepID=UPI0005636624|nr:16S rRNA (cytidine(1402)-2'-O)-methyltransferase [Marinobacterium jannaschii]
MSEAALYVVATPIGNLQDMTLRAVEVLQSVSLIAAEDTRHSARLLSHFNINTRQLSVHEHNERQRSEMIVQQLAAGNSVALISDAGTPLISDPGYILVGIVREAGYRVVPLPGCAAFVTALSAAGLASDRFSFEGFPPAKKGARLEQYRSLADESRTLIFYESPHRVLDSLRDMAQAFGGDRKVAVARELTKTFETIRSGSLDELLVWMEADHNQQKGEFVLLVEAAPRRKEESLGAEQLRILSLLTEELPVSQAAALAAKITGIKKKVLYQAALEINKG